MVLGPYVWLSQVTVLSCHPAKTSAKLVKHPEILADRIIMFAELGGQENLIAGPDYGQDGRGHPQIPSAKLCALRDGAALASKKLGVEFKSAPTGMKPAKSKSVDVKV